MKYVNILTKDIYDNDYAAYVGVYRKTGKAEACTPALLATVDCYPYQSPDIPEGYKQGDTLVNMGDYWTWQVVEKTVDDLKAETYVYQITPRQCRLYLAGQGVLAAVEQAIQGMGDAARIEWEYALEIKRDHALVLDLAQMLNYDEDALHQMFYQASQL
jgi:hypothetical protein